MKGSSHDDERQEGHPEAAGPVDQPQTVGPPDPLLAAGPPEASSPDVTSSQPPSEETEISGMPEPPSTSPGIPDRPTEPLFWGQWPPQPPATAPAPPRTGPPRRWRSAVAAIVTGFMLLAAGYGIGWKLSQNTGSSSTTQVVQTPAGALPSPQTSPGRELSTAAIAAKVSPAMVDIETYFDPGALGSGASGPLQRQGAATGLILTSTGEVLTNNHVVEGTTNLKVTIQGRSGTYDATVIGVDPSDDIALIQIQIRRVSGLPTVTLADSSTLNEGQRVVAIGNALGRGGSPSVTEGTITALNQTITAAGADSGPETLRNLIQSDASISPGDSGGALVNGSGQVVGMITAAGRTFRFQPQSTVGFAIPTNTALDIVNKIRTGQESSKIIIGQAGFIGVQVQDVDTATATRLGLNPGSGALVSGVLSGTPAARAGITSGSVITAVDGQTIDSVDALGSALHSHKPGARVQITWVDSNGTHSATLTLIGGPAV